MPGPGPGARPTPGVPVETRVLGSSWVPTASRPLALGGLSVVVSPAGFPHRQDDPASEQRIRSPSQAQTPRSAAAEWPTEEDPAPAPPTRRPPHGVPHAAPPNAALPPPRPQLAPPKRPLRSAPSEAPSPKRPQPAFPPAPPQCPLRSAPRPSHEALERGGWARSATWRRIRTPAPLRPWKWEKGQGAPPCTTTPSALPRPFPKDARAPGESDAARAALSWPPGVRERRIPLAADRGEAQRDGIGGNGNSGHPEAQNQRVRGAVFASQTLWDKRLSTVSGRPWAGVTLLRGKREAPPIRFYWGLLSHRLGGRLISGSQQPVALAGRSKDSLWLLQPHCPATLHDGRVPWEECKGKPWTVREEKKVLHIPTKSILCLRTIAQV
ncbi:uncharacterized protein [Macaca fascicularis]|uniref:uncharacterized protein n=1 Tax=Macaca fascicularis TaxID=9541 RepID=UPI0032B073D2